MKQLCLFLVVLLIVFGALTGFGAYQQGLSQGIYNSSAPTLVNTQSAPFQLDVNGNLKTTASSSPTSPVFVTSQGTTVVLPPAGWASGTAWTFPANKHVVIWTGIASGVFSTVYFDGGGTTATPAANVTNGKWDPMVPITKIYSPADGSFPSGLPTTGLYATY